MDSIPKFCCYCIYSVHNRGEGFLRCMQHEFKPTNDKDNPCGFGQPLFKMKEKEVK